MLPAHPSLAAEIALASGELEEERLTLAQKAQALATALPAGYWQALATTFLLYLARFDVAFITVHASTVGGVSGPGPGPWFASTQALPACSAVLTKGWPAAPTQALGACSATLHSPPGLPAWQVMNRAQVPMLTLFSMAPVVLLVSAERASTEAAASGCTGPARVGLLSPAASLAALGPQAGAESNPDPGLPCRRLAGRAHGHAGQGERARPERRAGAGLPGADRGRPVLCIHAFSAG